MKASFVKQELLLLCLLQQSIFYELFMCPHFFAKRIKCEYKFLLSLVSAKQFLSKISKQNYFECIFSDSGKLNV